VFSIEEKLPVISGKECVKALTKAGFYIRRRKSSHIVMRRDNPFAGAGLSVEEFNRLLE